MQTRDAVEDLHNCQELPSCLDEAMQTRKTSSIAQIKTSTKCLFLFTDIHLVIQVILENLNFLLGGLKS